MFEAINAYLESPAMNAVLDTIIFVFAFVPAVFVAKKLLVGEVSEGQRALASPRLLGWLFFFCGLEIVLHLMKVPIIIKVIAVFLAAIAFVVLFVMNQVL